MQSLDPLVTTMQEWLGILKRQLMGSFFNYARQNGLTMAQFSAMLLIYHKGACGVSDIGSDLGVTNSAASQMLERLVQLKLITRSEDPSDRRIRQIILTDKGREILKESTRVHQAWVEALVGALTTAEAEQVRAALGILIDKAHQLDNNPD